MHDVEKELIEATGYQTKRKFDNRQDYLGSIFNAALKLSDEDFEALSQEATDWYNAAVAAKNTKNQEIPDFDEVEGGDDEDVDDESGDEDIDDSDDNDSESDAESEAVAEEEAEPEVEPELPLEKPKKAKKEKAPKPVKEKPAKAAKPDKGEAKQDKWGCLEGSKNSEALHLFEKGATAREVKDQLGGATFYNLLARMVKNGHKLEREGALIKLTHKDAEAPKKSKK
jgi:hypothetical protein